MLKEKILKTINNNQSYQQVVNPSSADTNTEYLYASYSNSEENLTFKDRVLNVIFSNKYFCYLVTFESDKTSDDIYEDLISLTKFATKDNRVIMSADGKLIAPNY
jgi:hypothetical protein